MFGFGGGSRRDRHSQRHRGGRPSRQQSQPAHPPRNSNGGVGETPLQGQTHGSGNEDLVEEIIAPRFGNGGIMNSPSEMESGGTGVHKKRNGSVSSAFRIGTPELDDHTLRQSRETRIIPWTRSPFERSSSQSFLEGKTRKLSHSTPNTPQFAQNGTYFSEPEKTMDYHAGNGQSVEAEEVETEPADAAWVEGFQDLAFVSALSSFNEDHEVGTADQLGSYVAFFIIIWWTWASQVFYDTRYETSDLFHRLIKFVQFGAFVAWASYGNNFDVTFGLKENGEETTELLSEGLTLNEAAQFAGDSDKQTKGTWEAFTLVYVISRVLLIIQYSQLLVYASRARRLSKASFVPLVGTTVSMVFWAIAYTSSHHNSKRAAVARICLCYLGILIEISAHFLETQMKGFQSFKKTNIGERFGLMTLVILGEGVIGLTEVTRKVVQAFGFSGTTYTQIFCALIIVYLVFHVYFDGFSKEVDTGRLRSQWWAWLHFPTHLCIILIFAGIKGVLLWNNIGRAEGMILNRFNLATTDIADQNYNVNSTDGQELTKELRTLGYVWPTYVEQLQSDIQALKDAANNVTASNNTTPVSNVIATRWLPLASRKRGSAVSFDPMATGWLMNKRSPQETTDGGLDDDGSTSDDGTPVVPPDQNETYPPEVQRKLNKYSMDFNQLVGSVALSLFQAYGVDPEDEAQAKYNELMSNDTAAVDYGTVLELASLMDQQALGPSLYVSPTAGGFLVLTAVLQISIRWPRDSHGWMGFLTRFICGTVLCLFGFFDVGNKKIVEDNTESLLAYRWASSNWLLPTIVFVYAICVIVENCILLHARWTYRRLEASHPHVPVLLDSPTPQAHASQYPTYVEGLPQSTDTINPSPGLMEKPISSKGSTPPVSAGDAGDYVTPQLAWGAPELPKAKPWSR